MPKIINNLFKFYLRNGICERLDNGEIRMLEGKELRKAARELATFSITYADGTDYNKFRDYEYIPTIGIDIWDHPLKKKLG